MASRPAGRVILIHYEAVGLSSQFFCPSNIQCPASSCSLPCPVQLECPCLPDDDPTRDDVRVLGIGGWRLNELSLLLGPFVCECHGHRAKLRGCALLGFADCIRRLLKAPAQVHKSHTRGAPFDDRPESSRKSRASDAANSARPSAASTGSSARRVDTAALLASSDCVPAVDALVRLSRGGLCPGGRMAPPQPSPALRHQRAGLAAATPPSWR
jgi:hypothetical protein